MFIAQDDSAYNNAESQTNKISISGNIVPSNWYHLLLRPCGKSDTTAIAILSELVFLHRYNGNTEFQLNFNYFKRKFNFGISQAKDAVIRLEQAELLKRSLRTVIVGGRRFTNEMFLVLNIENVLKLNGQDQAKKFPLSGRKEKTDSPEISSDNIDKKENNKKSRSTGSNFNSNSFLKKENSSVTVTRKQRLSFASFYPLAQADIDSLRRLSGREFSSNAINEILLSLSHKLPNHDFPHKKAFINYMAKALSYEMRDAVRISNETFRIKSNISSCDTNFKEQEAFLSRIEESRDTSLAAQLKRKLAGILVSGIAYKFLSAASFPDKSIPVDSSTFKILLQTGVELNDHQKRLILAQVQSVYGNHINRLDFNIAGSIEHTKQSDTGDNTSLSNKPASNGLQGVWGKIRKNLIDYYGLGGLNLDRAWFSKLSAEEDEGNKRLILKAPSNFIKDWIETNYLQLIKTICFKENYQLTGVFV